ncbi:UNVERIFIED_CONTAM: hypothetical protein ABID98_003177 [Brevibacillus sp. OAP136]
MQAERELDVKIPGELCGVCNTELSFYQHCLMKDELNGKYTLYHMGCEHEAKLIQPCSDCGYHRKLCNDCSE